jgi:hypothetical protein
VGVNGNVADSNIAVVSCVDSAVLIQSGGGYGTTGLGLGVYNGHASVNDLRIYAATSTLVIWAPNPATLALGFAVAFNGKIVGTRVLIQQCAVTVNAGAAAVADLSSYTNCTAVTTLAPCVPRTAPVDEAIAPLLALTASAALMEHCVRARSLDATRTLSNAVVSRSTSATGTPTVRLERTGTLTRTSPQRDSVLQDRGTESLSFSDSGTSSPRRALSTSTSTSTTSPLTTGANQPPRLTTSLSPDLPAAIGRNGVHRQAPIAVVVTASVGAGVVAIAAVAGLLVPSAASQPARLMAAAAMAHCGESLDEPSYIEHPFQQHWLPVDSESPTEAEAQRQSDAEVAVTIAASSVNSALVAALFVASAFIAAKFSKSPKVQQHAATFAGTAAAYFTPNVASSVSGLALRGWLLASVGLSATVAAAVLAALGWVLWQHLSGRTAWSTLADGFAGGTREDLAKPPAGIRAEETVPWKRSMIRCHYFVDVATALAVASLSGLQPADVAACTWLSVVSCAVALLFLIYVAYLRPLDDAWEQNLTVTSSVGQVVLSAVVIVQLRADDADGNISTAFDYLTIAMSSFFFVQAVVLAVKAMVGDHADANQSSDGDGGVNTVPLLPSAPPQLLPDTGSPDMMATTRRAQKPGVEAHRSNPLATMHPTDEGGL